MVHRSWASDCYGTEETGERDGKGFWTQNPLEDCFPANETPVCIVQGNIHNVVAEFIKFVRYPS